MTEPVLQINGLAGVAPINIPTGGGIVAPVKPIVRPINNTSATKGGFWKGANIGTILGGLVNLGNAGANIITALKGNQPVFIQNPTTGQQIDVRAELDRVAKENNKSNEQILQMMAMMMQQNQQPQAQPKNNTGLYVGLAVGTVVLGGIVYLVATKKK